MGKGDTWVNWDRRSSCRVSAGQLAPPSLSRLQAQVYSLCIPFFLDCDLGVRYSQDLMNEAEITWFMVVICGCHKCTDAKWRVSWVGQFIQRTFRKRGWRALWNITIWLGPPACESGEARCRDLIFMCGTYKPGDKMQQHPKYYDFGAVNENNE